jgi:hypothetical protein
LLTGVQRFADDFCDATDLPGRIRRHPFAAMALGAGLGALGGPPLVRRLAASGLPAAALATLVKFTTRR